MLGRFPFLAAAFLVVSAALPSAAPAQELGAPPVFTPSYDDWGEHGLMQVPSARPGTDGDMGFTTSHVFPYNRYNLFFTPLPWMEAGFRYSAILNKPYAPGETQSYKDKSFDLKVRLFPETASFPETSIGFRDIAGTGLFSGEYLVFSRRYYDFDFSGGLGWGYMSTGALSFSNPLGIFSHSFKVRPGTGGAGAFTLDYFRGPSTAFFGGVEYHTRIEGVRLKLELDPDDYRNEPLGNTLRAPSPVNVAVVYDPYPFMQLSAGFERGNEFMLSLSLSANFNKLGLFKDTSKPPEVVPRPLPGPDVGVPLDETTLPRTDVATRARSVLPPPSGPDVGTPLDETTLPRTDMASAPAAPPLDELALAQPASPVTANGQTAGVDGLYKAARRLGYDIADVSIDGDNATITVATIPGRTHGSKRKLARLGAASLGVDRAVIADAGAVRTTPEGIVAASPANEDEGAAQVDGLYKEAQRLGYNIVDVSIDGDAAALTVAPIPGRRAGTKGQLVRMGEATLGVERAVVTETNAEGATPKSVEQQVADRIFADLKKIGFIGESFSMSGDHAWLSVSQSKYHVVTIALGRAERIVAADAPPNVEIITVDMLEHNLTALSATIYRRDLENAVAFAGSPEEIWSNATFAGADRGRPAGVTNDAAYPWFDWSLNPRLREDVGGPNSFFFYQIYAELAGTAHVTPGWSFDGSLGANLVNNFGGLQPNPASALPHVRSDIASYLKDGQYGILSAQSDYMFNIAPNWYGRVSGGILEYMYAGVDGEVLYRPYDERLAVGLDLNHVYQRGFDELFSFLPYQVTEGQLSLYYKLPFYNLTATLRVGRYLAGDKGATIELSRRFASGARLGIFASKTNVSAQQFGEGSFDKGFFLSFPLDLLLGNPSRSEASYVIRPLTRDGAQYIDILHPLYEDTDGYDPEELSKMWPSLLH